MRYRGDLNARRSNVIQNMIPRFDNMTLSPSGSIADFFGLS
jgi:hypothetical protein